MIKPCDEIFNALYKSTNMYFGWDLRKEFTDFLEKKDVAGKVALDIGCGEGRYSIYLAKKNCVVTALDLSQVGLDKLHRIATQKHLKITIRQQDLQEYIFPENQFDIIVAATILDHLQEKIRQNVVEGIITSLKNGGILYANVFTIFDPGYEKKANSLNTNFYGISDTTKCIEHFYQSNELEQQFAELEMLHYYEGIESDYSHGTPHHHGWASIIAQKNGSVKVRLP